MTIARQRIEHNRSSTGSSSGIVKIRHTPEIIRLGLEHVRWKNFDRLVF